ncbi:MAG: TetR/AcrR family transcriptional regulator [Bacteroidetes bacterium]|nr:MAG: TetR/AcrR family transcriptional regulator [Bacteroidota bacterium]
MKTERQIEITKVALELISEKGIQGLTIKNLAKRIGITEPAIYRHYDSKTDILIAVLELFKQNTKQLFEKELNNEGKAIDKIEHLFTKHFNSFSATPSLVSVIFSEEIFRNEPVLISKIAEIIDKNDKILTTIIVDGQKSGEIRSDIEANYLSTIIMGTLRLFVKKWQFSEFSYNLPSEGKKLIESIKLLIVK